MALVVEFDHKSISTFLLLPNRSNGTVPLESSPQLLWIGGFGDVSNDDEIGGIVGDDVV